MNDEQRRNTLAEAQAQYYGTRDEVARRRFSNAKTPSAEKALGNIADHARILGILDDQQAYGDPFAVLRSEIYRH